MHGAIAEVRNPTYPKKYTSRWASYSNPAYIRFFVFFCLLLTASPSLPEETPASRVVSINLCTDQLLLMLAEPIQIASISHLAQNPDSSFVAEQAQRYPINHARLEEVIAMQPDLVLAGSYSNPRLLRQLTKFGIQVEQFPLTHSLEGIEADIQRMADLLGRPQQGIALIEEMNIQLGQYRAGKEHTPPKALFYQPRGYTSGKHTLQDEALKAAGWRNIAAELGIEGYAPIDLEALLLAQPEQLFTSSHTAGTESRAQQQLHHPALQRLLKNHPIREIPFKYWICAGPMIVEAIGALNAAHNR